VYGDGGSGRTTVLKRALEHLYATTASDGLMVHLIDPSRGLIDLAEDPHVATYATTAAGAEKLALSLAAELAGRQAPEGASVAQLRAGTWRDGPPHLVIVDDYDLLVSALGSPLAPLADIVAQAREVGLHLMVARRVAGSQRSAFEPFTQRFRDLRPTTLVLAGTPDEGPIAGGVTPGSMPPGRAHLVAPNGHHQLIQCCLPGAGES
jgi:DNA segregation ATPase FtsK/SpoIIIE, S-DNA-T family